MNVYPLKSLSIEEATMLQFKLVHSITNVFPGNEILTRGDLGVVKGLNQPITTHKVENVLADFFEAEAAILVRGAGTNAIRLALHAAIGSGGKLLVHDAPIYPTTNVSIEMLGIQTIQTDFNKEMKVLKTIQEEKPTGVLIQVTRQKLEDSYDLETLIQAIRKENPNLPIVTDDNYSAMKTKGIGSQLGGSLACFSTFKLLGPEGVGCIVGEKTFIQRLRKENYSGGGQVQGHEALDVLRGLIYAPISLAISAKVGDEVCQRLMNGEINGIKKAFVVNAQSRVVIVQLTKPLAKRVIEEATLLGALPNPVGAESKYEFSPLIYRVSGTFRAADPSAEDTMIRINPNRAGATTILTILKEAMKQANK